MNFISTKDNIMAMNSDKWELRLKSLELTHLELDSKIKKLESLREDSTVIQTMKKHKLRLKEQIESIRKDINF